MGGMVGTDMLFQVCKTTFMQEETSVWGQQFLSYWQAPDRLIFAESSDRHR